MKTTSEAQQNANFRNSMRSQGPVTRRGRQASKMNAYKHGFAGLTILIAEHEQEAYSQHFTSLRNEYKPVGPTEEFMVHSLAGYSFAAEQIRVLTTNRINMLGCRPVPNPNGSHTPETDHATAQAFSATELAPSLGNLSLYEQRKMRLFQTTRKELLQIQAERKTREKVELEEAARLRKADQISRQPNEKEWEPSENGFVCSLLDLDRYITREERKQRLLKVAI